MNFLMQELCINEQGYPDGEKTGGPITMRRALELSHNTPAVRFLLQDVTIDKSAGFLEKMGFDPDHLSKTASGLGLGATDVTTLEMTGGFATSGNICWLRCSMRQAR